MRIFVICSVRNATQEYRDKLEDYVLNLEEAGNEVHLPHRDTNQKQSGIDICRQNCSEIKDCDEVHIFYSKDSQGTHFDMGSAFAFKKKIKVVENESFGEGKSYPRMLTEWEHES